ncbi:MAG: hypothetical protein U5L96_21935 [Owenweeksia sp.]|nr:hypothetical protein [Owenweeksia sp.]
MAFDLSKSNLPNTPLITGDFDQLGYDPIEKQIYLSDPLDGTQPGDIYRFDEGGGQLDLFQAGKNPSGFGFR